VIFSPRSGGLVDYDEEEDEEDCRPSSRNKPETSEEYEATMKSIIQIFLVLCLLISKHIIINVIIVYYYCTNSVVENIILGVPLSNQKQNGHNSCFI